MDLSSTYRSIIKKHFPNAKIVADRFHVIRLIQHHCTMTYRELTPEVKSHRGLLSILRTRPDNLSEKKKLKRDEFLSQHLAVDSIYQFQQQLHSPDASVYIPAIINNLSEHKNKFVVLKYVQFTEYV
jgi:transposase